VLESSDDTAQRIIGSQLGDLAVALQNDPINPEEVGRLLISVGESTIIVGEDAGEDQLVALGDVLTQAGTSLAVEATSE
jgi:precorrin-6B methylase 1